MTLFFVTPIIAVLLPLLVKPPSEGKPLEHSLQGTISSKETGKPLADIYLYTLKGEEEAITNQKGEFKFLTWKKLPVTIHIHYNTTEVIRVMVSNPSHRIKINL